MEKSVMSSPSQAAEQYGTRLHCSHCDTHGYATWEVNDQSAGAIGTIIRITPGFFVRGSDQQGGIEIACLKCNS
jgi:hypothetical protein